MLSSIFSSKKICNNTWLIQGEGCNSYLVVGNKQALLIDTGFATENIQRYAQKLTSVPVKIAANTHGHFDHTGGNGWFKHAYMSAKALEIAKIPYPSLDPTKYSTDYIVTIVGDGDIIDLGNRILEVIEIPAHAPSSIAFFDSKERIMFTGDEVEKLVMLVWMQDEPQPTIEQHANNMKKLLRYREGFDYICTGHSLVMEDASLVEDYLEHDLKIISGLAGNPWVPTPGGPADFNMPQPQYKLVSRYKNTALGYDLRYITNS